MKKRVIAVYNKAQSSFAIMAGMLARCMPDKGFIVCPVAHAAAQADRADVLLCLWWPFLSDGINEMIRAKATILGIYDFKSWEAPAQRESLGRAMARADALVVANAGLQTALAVTYGQTPPIFICPDGVDTVLFHPMPLQQRFTVMWAGNSEAGGREDLKGLDLVEAACALAKVPLVIADSSGKRGTALTYEQMRDFYSQGTVLAIASRVEGGPRTLLEALACGRPVVATRCGLVPELIQHGINGAIVEREVSAFAAGLTYMQRQMALGMGPHISAAAASSVRAWDVEVFARRWRHAFNACANGRFWGIAKR